MGKFKWVLLCSLLLVAFSISAAAAPKADTNVFFSAHETTSFSSVLIAYGTYFAGDNGAETAMSVSNTMGVPAVDGVTFMGFPSGGDVEGGVWLFCFANDADEPFVFYSGANPEVGSGLDEAGVLAAGNTWVLFLHEALREVGLAEDGHFAGYCYVVGEFDAVAGTYVNTLKGIASQQAYPMQADFTGTPIGVMVEPAPAQ